jgi:ABC-type nitrate/sulfonate/bicarbonate transport system substrate-binding protein
MIGLITVLLVSCASAPPAPPKTVNLIVFPGGFNWPIWVAQEKGLFAKNGIEVKVTPTPSSVFQLTNLIDGKFDIAMTAIDNLIAYREGQGEVNKPGPDLFAFMGGDNGFLRLVTVPEVKTFNDLRGKELSVDALTTGYAFVLLEIMERNGLMKDRDYTTPAAGGVLQRFQALMEKKHAGTLLLSPFEVQAEARAKPGPSRTATRSWATSGPSAMRSIGSMIRATGTRRSRSSSRIFPTPTPRRPRLRTRSCSARPTDFRRKPKSTWKASRRCLRCARNTGSRASP